MSTSTWNRAGSEILCLLMASDATNLITWHNHVHAAKVSFTGRQP